MAIRLLELNQRIKEREKEINYGNQVKTILDNKLNQFMEEYTIQRKENITVIVPLHHKHTLLWIHGLNQFHQKHMNYIIQALGVHISQVKIIIPRAPNRFVTCMNQQASSWFDIKFRSQKSFIVPFDEAFSSEQVIDSFESILKPIILEEKQVIKSTKGKFIVCGFSQGGGMSLHCLYSLPEIIDAAIGISGYLFPFTNLDPLLKKQVYVIYGDADDLRPWEYTKTTYEGKIPAESITLIKCMKHSIDPETKIVLAQKLQSILGDHKQK